MSSCLVKCCKSSFCAKGTSRPSPTHVWSAVRECVFVRQKLRSHTWKNRLRCVKKKPNTAWPGTSRQKGFRKPRVAKAAFTSLEGLLSLLPKDFTVRIQPTMCDGLTRLDTSAPHVELKIRNHEVATEALHFRHVVGFSEAIDTDSLRLLRWHPDWQTKKVVSLAKLVQRSCVQGKLQWFGWQLLAELGDLAECMVSTCGDSV